MPTLGFEWRDAFLEALRTVPVVQHACDAAGVNRSTAYAARKGDKEFATAWDEAMEAGIDCAEKEAFRRAVQGFDEPVIWQGQLIPVWARDAKGEVVTRVRYSTDPKTRKRVRTMVPVQATDGAGRPMWLTQRRHSDQLLVTILKGRRKAVYSERTELTGADGKPMEMDATTKAARIAALMAAAKQRRAAAKGAPASEPEED